MIKLSFSAILALLTLTALAQTPAAPPAPKVDASYVPQETRVAILPVPNISGEKWEDLKTRESATGLKYLQDNFTKRGFTLVPQDEIQKALTDLKIDLTDEEQYRRDVLYSVGKQTNATLVALVVITDTSQKLETQLFSYKREGHTKIKAWLVDSDKASPVFSAKSMDGSSGGSVFAGWDKGSDRQVIATANAIRDVFHDFWSGYKELKAK